MPDDGGPIGFASAAAAPSTVYAETSAPHVTTATNRFPDLCIIGGGSGGLSVAAAAAALGVSVVLVEKGKMGGDCLNTGCVPSKALIAAAKRLHDMRSGSPFGITNSAPPRLDWNALRNHVQGVIGAIAPNDSVERFESLGVRVIRAAARFVASDTVEAGGMQIKARRFIIATGSRPAVPAIPGLESIPYLTNETIFTFDEPIEHLIVIGGGPIGMELAQAYRRLGSAVTMLESATILRNDDPELSAVAVAALRTEGVDIRAGVQVLGVTGLGGAIQVHVNDGAASSTIAGTHLLIATGRMPTVDGLDLHKAGIKADKRGILVDAGMVTSNRRVFAIGDVAAGGLRFTHVANQQAGIVIKRALFRLPAKISTAAVPWVTFTDPEIAQVGLTEAQARAAGNRVVVYRWPLHENDRAQAERDTRGFIKVVCAPNGRILGAGIAGSHAGELIQIWCLALSRRLKIGAMTNWVAPYPTLGEISKRAALTSLGPMARHPAVRYLLALLRKLD